MFHNNNPILAGLVVPDHSSTSDQSVFIKKETSTSSKMVLEVCLQKSNGKLLFAEAKEDFVEFLFCFLSIPLGTVIGTLMNGASSISCMDSIFKSISSMSVGRYLKSQEIKDMLLKPHFGQQYSSRHQLFPLKGISTTQKVINSAYQLKDPRSNEQLLRPSGMFFVTDDLVVSPSSSQLAMNTLAKYKVTLNDIEKYEISIGLEQGLRLLKTTLRSRSTLTSILEHQLKK
ncbi:hypothetical protein HanPI659440_Chr09g0318041 [Helianthus annuus]|nr:hypothetical protein HanPI659440_Chr09g0318041 [Helianthus annuus]